MPPLRIVVADSDSAHCARIARLANLLHFPCDVFASAEELLRSGVGHEAGVVVSEFRLVGMNGIDMQQNIRQINPYAQFVFCTEFAKTWLTVLAMQNGAFTVLDKPITDHELQTHIGLAMEHYQTLLRQNGNIEQIRRSFNELDWRERDVLQLMMDGLPNKQIAARLEVSLRTVEYCRHAIFEKTITDSLAELVRLVTLAGIEFDQGPESP